MAEPVGASAASTLGFDDVLAGLLAFLDLCSELELREPANSGRFRAYVDTIERLRADLPQLRAHDAATWHRTAKDLPKILVALAESQEVGSTVPFLRTCSSVVLVPRVRLLVQGPELRGDEDQASNQARNAQFELWLAALLWRTGVDVSLEEPDLVLRLKDKEVLVACKRLLSLHKLTKRINEATAQLGRSLTRARAVPAWGLIAISLSRISTTTPDQSQPIASRAAGLDELDARIERLVFRRAKWVQSREAQGVVFHDGSIYTNAETDRVETGHFFTLVGDGPVCAEVATILGRAIGVFASKDRQRKG